MIGSIPLYCGEGGGSLTEELWGKTFQFKTHGFQRSGLSITQPLCNACVRVRMLLYFPQSSDGLHTEMKSLTLLLHSWAR